MTVDLTLVTLNTLYEKRALLTDLMSTLVKCGPQISQLIQKVPRLPPQTLLKLHPAANLTLGSRPKSLRASGRKTLSKCIYLTKFFSRQVVILFIFIFFKRVGLYHFWDGCLVKSHFGVRMEAQRAQRMTEARSPLARPHGKPPLTHPTAAWAQSLPVPLTGPSDGGGRYGKH